MTSAISRFVIFWSISGGLGADCKSEHHSLCRTLEGEERQQSTQFPSAYTCLGDNADAVCRSREIDARHDEAGAVTWWVYPGQRQHSPGSAADEIVHEWIYCTDYLRPADVAAKATSIFTMGGVLAATGCSLLASAGGSSTAGQTDNEGRSATSSVESGSRSRAPSATLAFVLMGQIQFLATLSLVDSTGDDDSWILAFARHLRWANLWLPLSVIEEFTPLKTTRRLQETDGSSRCELAEAGSSEIGAVVFIGNLLLFAGILLAIFLLHVFLASGVEAYWLEKERANNKVEIAQLHGTPIHELSTSRRSQGMGPVGQLDDSDAAAETKDQGRSRGERNENDDEEKGHGDVSRSESRWSMVSACRDRSTSAWLHYPHVELVFLLFAFEGAVAAGVSALRESRCPWIIIAAAAALLLYPVLMFVMVCRTIVLRVRTDDLIVFEPTTDPNSPKDVLQDKDTFLCRVITSWKESHSLISWADAGQWVTVERSHTESRPEDDWVQTTVDEDSRRKGDRFRIGFEPLFVDFTKNGSWFMVYSLVQSVAFAFVGVLIDESVQQLSLFCGQFFVTCIVLVLFKPFANRFINTVAVCLSGVDAVCMAVLTIAALAWEGTDKAKRADHAVVIIQLMVLAALILPMYVEVSAFIVDAVSKYMGKKTASEIVEENAEEKRRYVRRYVLRAWGGTWCRMLRKNMFACVEDTTEGVRRPRVSGGTLPTRTSKAKGRLAAAATWPYSAMESSSEDTVRPRRPTGLGTMNTPVVVAPVR